MPRTNPFDVVPPAHLRRSRVLRSYGSFEHSDTTLDTFDTAAPSLKHQAQPFRLYVIALSLLVVVLALFARAAWLQTVRGSTFRSAAENNRTRVLATAAPRGIIYDRNRQPLVENVAEFSIALIPTNLPRAESDRTIELQKIAETAGLKYEDILATVQTAQGKGKPINFTSLTPVILREHVSYEDAIALKVKLQNSPSVQVQATPRRHYVAGDSFSAILGYTGKLSDVEWAKLNQSPQTEYQFSDVIGKTGLEAYYENQLRGVSEQYAIEVNAQRREQKVITAKAAVPGQNLVTSIDEGLQQLLSTQLQQAIAPLTGRGAAAVAIDPRTGGILAMVSVPSFDNNSFVEGIGQQAYQKLATDARHPLFFRPTAGEYPSGSTIKPVVASAALDQGIITAQTTVLSVGGIRIGKWFFPDWKAGGHGVTNVTKAIAESVNTFFYTIGGGTENFQGLGIDRMTQYARAFGLGAPTGIDLPGERGGFLPSKAWKEQTKGEPWYIGDTYHFAIGQGDLLVTPLQMALVTATVANGGTLYKPHVVAALENGDGSNVRLVPSEAIREPLQHPEVIDIVRQGMRQAVTSGSARRLQDLGVPAAGKTGTAQFGTGKSTHAWFIGFAPYDNPTIAIAVIVEGGGEGHAAALPIADSGMRYWLQHQKAP